MQLYRSNGPDRVGVVGVVSFLLTVYLVIPCHLPGLRGRIMIIILAGITDY